MKQPSHPAQQCGDFVQQWSSMSKRTKASNTRQQTHCWGTAAFILQMGNQMNKKQNTAENKSGSQYKKKAIWMSSDWYKNIRASSVADLKALNVEVETEGLYDHGRPLP